jgi:prepilin-type N-terminal cleavage/methylation domain-containing protein
MAEPRGRPRRGERGFSLLEVLAALIIASLMIAVLSRGLATAAVSTRAPAEVVSAMAIARVLAAEARDDPTSAPEPRSGSTGRYTWRIDVAELGLQPATPPFPPAPRGVATGGGGQDTVVVQRQTEGAPEAAAAPPPVLYRIAVAVTAPSGRSVTLETAKLVTKPNDQQR